MFDNKLHLAYAEFYITNVCNLTCEGCNRFNSFKFKGWQSWQQWQDIYQRWSQEINLGTISIMGGEPLLNPECYQWIKGISALWPDTQVMIASNGTQLHRHQKLYDLLTENRRIGINVSIHNKMHKRQIIEKIKNFLIGPFEYLADTTKYRESIEIIDSRGIRIKIFYNWWFHQGAIIADAESGGLRLHDSDPIQAHDICHSKTCHHFDHGRLYKCGPSALFSVFDQQLGLQLTDEDRMLIKAAPSIGIDDSLETKKRFLQHIDEPIPQCKFCPETYNGKQIFAIEKKHEA